MDPIKSFSATVCLSSDRLEIFLKDANDRCLADIVLNENSQLFYTVISTDSEDKQGDTLYDLYDHMKIKESR